MTEQIKTTNAIPLLDDKGNLTCPSYATSDLFQYNREKIAQKRRIKEWEFYQVNSRRFFMQITYGHVTYAGSVSFTLYDFETNERYTSGGFKLFPNGRFNLPFTSGSEHDINYKNDEVELHFANTANERTVCFQCKGKTDANVSLTMSNDGDAMCYCIPFGNKRFYYNFKKIFSGLAGSIVVNGKQYPLDDAYCLVDSGRGVWPYKHQWYWGMAEGLTGGKRIAFDLGYSNVDTGATNENMYFVNGVQHKLGKIDITHSADYTQWSFEEEQGRLSLALHCTFDNKTETNLIFMHNRCHQVFGNYNGYILDDDGNKTEINNFFGFCEHSINRW